MPGVVLVIGICVGPQVFGLVHPGTMLIFLSHFGLGVLF
jgi:hypothetical protein